MMEITPGTSGTGPALPDLASDLAPPPTVSALPPALLKPQIIEAVVLRNTLLPPSGNPQQPSTLSQALLGAGVAAGASASGTTNVTANGTANTASPASNVASNLQQSLQSSAQATLLAAVRPTTNAANSQIDPQLRMPLLQTNQPNRSANLFRVVLQWQGQRIELVSPQPLPTATPLQIQVTSRNEFILRNTAFAALTTPQGNATETPAGTRVQLSTQPLSLSGSATGSPSNLTLATSGRASSARPLPGAAIQTQAALPSALPASAASSTAMPPTLSSPTVSPQQRLQQLMTPLVRENLPRQQPLSVLIPALRQLITPTQLSRMPPALAHAVLNLWQSLPTPKQLQQPATLKQALSRSGSFFEAAVATARAAKAPESAELPELSVPRILGTDLKAQLMVLLTILKSRPNVSAPPSESAPMPTEQDSTYKKPQIHDNNLAMAANKKDLSTDSLLQQLGKMLEGGLSRIHLNQLDSVLSRHPTSDTTTNIPTWVMEMPLQTQYGQQHVGVRIEEHNRKQENKKYKQWLVQLSFDLHELGKLAATLSIVEHSVGATLWAEREQTHHTVQREMNSLRKGLEAVGVNVTEMHCRLGIPPERSSLIGRGLVDTHT